MTNLLTAALAGLPILTILALMLGLRWSAAKAGVAGLSITLALAWWVFGYGTQTLPQLGPVWATLGSLAEAGFVAATILWIIFPALCIHELQRRTGAVDRLQAAIGRVSRDPRITALLIAWFFALFMEGAAGFGTSAALAAPFLVSAGFGRVEAVTLALIGHAVGVSFGAVGTPILPQEAASGFDSLQLSAATGVYHALLGWLIPVALVVLVSRTQAAERFSQPAIVGWTLLAALLFLLPYYAIAYWVGPELPTLGGSLIGGLLFVFALLMLNARASRANNASTLSSTSSTDGSSTTDSAGNGKDTTVPADSLLQAAAPYLVLVALVVLTRLVPPVQEALRSITLKWQYDQFQGSMAVLYHPGTLLLLSFLLGAACQRAPYSQILAAMQLALKRLLPVTLALVAMLGLSRLMVHAGMIETLATIAATSIGSLWPLFAPLVGVLGTFVTGSATASNILFSDFQLNTAERLNLSGLALLGAQGFGAAVGNSVCPHNIVAAGATVHLAGREGDVLRQTFVIAFVYAMLGGLLALLWLA